MADYRQEIRDAFPELDEVESEGLREKIVDVWDEAFSASEYDSIWDAPRSTFPVPGDPSPRATRIIDHVQDVTLYTVLMTDQLLDRFDVELDRDVAIAGALTHDISKVYELSENTDEEFEELLPHPHYAIHPLAAADFPLGVLHIAISHSHFSGVEPKTIEAQIVYHADMVALHGLFWSETGELASHV